MIYFLIRYHAGKRKKKIKLPPWMLKPELQIDPSMLTKALDALRVIVQTNAEL